MMVIAETTQNFQGPVGQQPAAHRQDVTNPDALCLRNNGNPAALQFHRFQAPLDPA